MAGYDGSEGQNSHKRVPSAN